MKRRRDRDEQGMTIVLVGLLAVALLVISAFTIDFGQAYVSKRNLQKAADAGALAAAQELTQFPGTCNNVASNSTARTNAHLAADDHRQSNREDNYTASRELDFDVRCDPDLRVLVVDYEVEGDTTSFFGPLAGGENSITTDRRAQAIVDVAPGANEGMRPLALCSASFDPTYMERSGDFVRVHFPGAGRVPPEACGGSAPGNWWLIDCPGERTGAAGGPDGLPTQIREGCQDPVSVIPGQTDATTPGQLTVVLEDACPTAEQYSETCMSGNPGNISQGQNAEAWKDFIDSGETALFPVFCAPTSCDAVTLNGNGTNAVFPIYRLVSAVVCGFHYRNNASDKYDSSHENCAGNPYPASSDTSGNNYFVFKFKTFRSSSTNAESECALGAECDGGLRRTRLSE